jgi:hypothetical protein
MERLSDEHRVHGPIVGRDLLRRPVQDPDLGQPAGELRAHPVVRFDGEHLSRGYPTPHYRRGELASARAQIKHY